MRWLNNIIQRASVLQTVVNSSIGVVQPAITISERWQTLGPFTIGTREATWGADPLESIGGFRSLVFNETNRYKSSLAANGTIAWTATTADVTYLNNDAVNIELKVAFPEVDWRFLQQVYGWAALQWQGWARGHIVVNSEASESFNLDLDKILELWIDDKHYFGGDFYGFHKAPVLLRLEPGPHKVDIRLIRDVRAMGGITDNPSIDVKLLLTRTRPMLRQMSQVLYPDRLGDWRGPTASTYASVVLRNDNDTDIYVYLLEAKHNACQAELISPTPIRLVPGQSRPIAFQIDCISGTSASTSIDMHFSYYADAHHRYEHKLFVGILAQLPVPEQEPHIITYLLPSGIVSYAILRPPSVCEGYEKLPVLLALHGAGVDVDSEEAKHSFDEVDDVCAWTLLPSGVTSWSGDDWHNWGWSDVEAAIGAIPGWIEKVEWRGPGVDTSRWLVVGHSNGGQGAWYVATHQPDNITAAAPISGYSSIENYVPYTFWHTADAMRMAVVHAQLDNYRHELLLENVQDVPLLQQHGSADDNVPAYHSRLMYELVDQAGGSSTYMEYAHMPHWWAGVMTTSVLSRFYKTWLPFNQDKPAPDVQGNFTVIAANPSNTGSRHGIRILSLVTPGQLGRLHVSPRHCAVRTENVERFELAIESLRHCNSLDIDAVSVALPHQNKSIVRRLKSDVWHNEQTASQDLCERGTHQHGGLEAILRTNGTFNVVPRFPGTEDVALQIANNLIQYFSADVAIATTADDYRNASGNVISISIGQDLSFGMPDCAHTCHMELDDHNHFIIAKDDEALYSFDIAREEIVAAAFLSQLPGQRLELVFWAIDVESLDICTRLLPLMTGGGQPDFVLATRKMLAQGLSGVFAMGFLDTIWCPASTSFFATGMSPTNIT